MYYEINVAFYGKHLFATHERSVVDEHDLEKVYNIFKEKFPVTEGYRITVTRWNKSGENIDMETAQN